MIIHLGVTWGSADLVCIHLGGYVSSISHPPWVSGLVGTYSSHDNGVEQMEISKGFTSIHASLVQARFTAELKA